MFDNFYLSLIPTIVNKSNQTLFNAMKILRSLTRSHNTTTIPAKSYLYPVHKLYNLK